MPSVKSYFLLYFAFRLMPCFITNLVCIVLGIYLIFDNSYLMKNRIYLSRIFKYSHHQHYRSNIQNIYQSHLKYSFLNTIWLADNNFSRFCIYERGSSTTLPNYTRTTQRIPIQCSLLWARFLNIQAWFTFHLLRYVATVTSWIITKMILYLFGLSSNVQSKYFE